MHKHLRMNNTKRCYVDSQSIELTCCYLGELVVSLPIACESAHVEVMCTVGNPVRGMIVIKTKRIFTEVSSLVGRSAWYGSRIGNVTEFLFMDLKQHESGPA